MEEMYVVDQQGNRYGGAAAFQLPDHPVAEALSACPADAYPVHDAALALGLSASRQAALCDCMGKTADACDDGACKVHFK